MDGTETLTVDPADFEIVSPVPANTVSGKHRRFRALLSTWWKQAQQLKTEAHVYFYAFRHPGMPWYARLVALCTAGYLVSPIQLIPSFIPVISSVESIRLSMVAGGRIQLLVSPKPPVTITGDAGAGGANLDYHVAGVLGDKVGRKTILQGGYRYLHANYRNSQNFVYDIFTSGSSFGAPSISNDV